MRFVTRVGRLRGDGRRRAERSVDVTQETIRHIESSNNTICQNGDILPGDWRDAASDLVLSCFHFLHEPFQSALTCVSHMAFHAPGSLAPNANIRLLLPQSPAWKCHVIWWEEVVLITVGTAPTEVRCVDRDFHKLHLLYVIAL